jgi:hypothetical protein
MAFSPVLDICFETCSLIKFVDVTGLYSVSNTNGYGETTGITGSTEVASAIILVTDEDGETIFEYDVTSEFPVAMTGDLIFSSYEYSLPDGDFTLTYTITHTNNTVYTYSSSFLNTCNFECCIDSLIATIPAKICANRCDTDYIDEVLTIEGLLYGYMCAAQCEKSTIKAEIEKRLERFCDFQCNCN